MCLLTNITYQSGFSFSHLGPAPGVELGDARGMGGGGQKFNFSKIQPNLVCELLT